MGQNSTRERVAAELAQREAELLQSGLKPVGTTAAPAGDLAANPQVQALIQRAVAEAVAPLVEQLGAKRGGELHGGDKQFLEGLALAIQQLSDQGKPQATRHVAPEIMAARGRAREAMVDAILKARAAGIEPEYDIINATFLADELVQPFAANAKLFMDMAVDLPPWKRTEHVYGRTRVGWAGVPNEAMAPANDAAREIHAHFLASIGGGTAARAEDPLAAKLSRVDSDPVRLRNRGEAQKVRILGTIAEPASQQI